MRGTPAFPTSNAETDAWPSGFAYDIDVVHPFISPAAPPQPRGRSYASVAAARSTPKLPPATALGSGFASSSAKGEAVSRC